jgi:hypothetical protein
MRCISCARRGGINGDQSMSSTIAGGTATTTRLARTDPRSLTTTTWSEYCRTVRTGADSATREPSWSASRSGTSCEPPTKRESCAPSSVLDDRSKVPGFAALPAVAMYQRKNSSDMSSPSLPKAGCR